MRVEIEIENKRLNNKIIQCFKNKNINHKENLIFISSGHKEDFSNMFLAMFQLINDDDIFPYLNKVLFIDDNGDIEDVLIQFEKIREINFCDEIT